MSKARDNHRKAAKEQYKRDKTFVELHDALTTFHKEQVAEYGQKFLARNIDPYRRLLIKYVTLYSRAFCKPIDASRTTMVIVTLLNELDTK